MASGQDSEYLRAGLQGAGLSGWADIHFGPDLINCAKESALYYVRILEQMGSNPADLLVVDDDPLALEWAMALGCKGLQTKLGQKRDTPTVIGVSGVLTDWRNAPRLAQEILGT
jgi:methionine salvage enolase-phosphatase E1